MIDFRASVIDTRAIAERVDELESEYSYPATGELAPAYVWGRDDRQEWQRLTDLLEKIGDEARHGVTLIHEAHLEEYIRDQYADTWGGNWTKEDPRTFQRSPVTWDDIVSQLPFSCIDWERVAEECRSDYTSIDIDGSTYYYMA